MEEDNKIILVGKHITEYQDEIADGHVQVELDIDDTLNEIGWEYLKKYARDTLDLTEKDDLDDVDEDYLIDELSNRNYDFCKGSSDEKLTQELESRGYKVLDEYDEEYYEYLQISTLDVQDMYMLKEIIKKFMDATVFEKETINKVVTSL